MDPSQMEGYLTYYYEYHFLYITGIEHVETKNIQGAALMKLVFHPGHRHEPGDGADCRLRESRASLHAARRRAAVHRALSTQAASGRSTGFLRATTRSPGEMQDFALNRVRPLFATLPGVSAPPPFGGNQRTIVVRLDPDKMREYRVSPEEAIAAVNRSTS